MTPKQILDSFSEMLMQDERILSAQERSLLSALLQHADAIGKAENAGTQQAVAKVIASAVGETVAQRAFSVLGATIVEKILGSGAGRSTAIETPHGRQIYGGPNPNPVPQPPGPRPPGVEAPRSTPAGTPVVPLPPGPVPQPPTAPQSEPRVPQPPSHGVTKTTVSQTRSAVEDRPSLLPGRCVVLDEFLAPQELEQIAQFALQHENDFRSSEVIAPDVEGGLVDYEHRRSQVLMDLGPCKDLMLERVQSVLPQVLEKLGIDEFPISGMEAQITASNDGDFFRFHSDNGSESVRERHLTFVYFFHREPRPFEGGELRIHDAKLEGNSYESAGSYQTVVPRQNQIVFFPCKLMHEITPVRCPSGRFADSRFTLNGWLRR